MTFDNEAEVAKCAQISKRIRLILRIITDDSGSQCRLSSKFGAPPAMWHPLLASAKKHGLEVVGVSFHVGSGCRDASRYDLAIRDAKELFKMAKKEFGFEMTILDIGGGFPGETHSLWNPAARDATRVVEDDKEEHGGQFMFFNEIADHVAPFLGEFVSLSRTTIITRLRCSTYLLVVLP
jgi:ornithine decarboxylase